MRKRRAVRRILSPDPKFNDILVSRFVNSIMLHGKKNTARRILYGAMGKSSAAPIRTATKCFAKRCSMRSP